MTDMLQTTLEENLRLIRASLAYLKVRGRRVTTPNTFSMASAQRPHKFNVVV